MPCEMCGKTTERLININVEGSILKVCSGCLKYGKRVIQPRTRMQFNRPRIESEIIVVSNYSEKIERARQSRGIKQEEFAKQLKEIATNYKQPKFHSPTLPFCILEELKEYIGGMESGHINLRGKLQANSDSEMHKLDVCEQCKYYYSCPGIMNGYTEIYSDSEFKPIC